MPKEQHFTEILKTIFQAVALAIPVSQLVVAFIPQSVEKFFLSNDIIGPVLILTFLVTSFVSLAYYNNPYFRFLIPWLQDDSKYQDYLSKTDRNKYSIEEIKNVPFVKSPRYIDGSDVALTLIPITIFSGFLFISLGLIYHGFEAKIEPYIILTQAFSYFFTIVSSIFILFTYVFKLMQKGMSEELMKSRIGKAINLAKENNSFDNFPQIVFRKAFDYREGFSSSHIVEVKVGKKIFQIVTDYKAEVLSGVYEIEDATD